MEIPGFICSVCKEEICEDDYCWFEDKIYCVDCVEEETIVCRCCGERIIKDNNAGDDETPLCVSCYERHYTSCERCDCILHQDDVYYCEDDDFSENPYCFHCYDQLEKNAYLRNYSYKPEPVFYGDNKRYLGVELELDFGGKSERHARILCNLANKENDHIYIKTDGSLNDGLEIVTHPMSLDYHMIEMPWESLLNCALTLDYASHKTDTCGLHVHVNRDSFSYSHYVQDECIGRVLYLVERFWQELLKFSRRTEAQLNRWASRYGYKEHPAEILDTAKNGNKGRYTCINLENHSTIEFRIFRGTLRHNTLIATLQLVNLICDVAFILSDEEISKLGWPDFIERADPDSYPELITYLKERRLYINEPITVQYREE